ncbi:MAG: hypothetical protein ABR538_16055 [Candidatus Binatia bacterium]
MTEMNKGGTRVPMAMRLSTELSDPRLVRLLKLEAHESDTTIKDVLSRALEAWFADRLETKALARLAESSFAEWDDPRDADYDRL